MIPKIKRLAQNNRKIQDRCFRILSYSLFFCAFYEKPYFRFKSVISLCYNKYSTTIVDYDDRMQQLILAFPNEEVKYGFWESLLPVYAPGSATGSGKDIFSLKNCVNHGDTDGIKEIITALPEGIPYTNARQPFEQYFEVAIYLIFSLLGRLVQCGVHSGKGRADCMVETQDFVYLFEFKLDKSADEALAQIEEKQYALPYAADARTVYKIGVNFDSKERNITEWKVRE